MATPGTRHRRMMLLSAPPMNRLPRLDSHQVRRELTMPERRQGTARLRRHYLDSRRHDYVEDSTRKAEIEKLKQYKKYLDNMKIPSKNIKDTDSLRKDESLWEREITKIDVPERLPISVPIRLGSAKGSIRGSEHLPNTNPLFYRVSMSARTKKSTAVSYEAKPVIKQKLQYFIHQDWSSEKISWNHLHKYVPEFQKTSWIC